MKSDQTLQYDRQLRVMMVVPGQEDDLHPMIFARRQISAIEKAGITVYRFFLTSRTSVRAIIKEFLRFRQIIKKFQPNLIHAHYGTVTALFCSLSVSIPLIITFRGNDLNPDPHNSYVRDRLSRMFSQIAAMRAKGIICVSEEIKNRIWWNNARRRARVIPVGVNLDDFTPISKDEARKALGWSCSNKIIVFNSGLQYHTKRLDLAEAAVEVARSFLDQVEFLVLRGDVQPAQMPLVLNAADVLLLTSDTEGSPNIVKEAMACNLPVVSVRAGDVQDRLRRVEPSRVVDRDPRALGQALVEILNINQRSNGAEIAKQEISEPFIIQKIINVYNETLRKNILS